MSTVRRERPPPFPAIAKFSSFWHVRFVTISKFLFHEEDQRFQQEAILAKSRMTFLQQASRIEKALPTIEKLDKVEPGVGR
jgi:hypothetical protein